MKRTNFLTLLGCFLIILSSVFVSSAQKRPKAKPAPKQKEIVFAVIEGGTKLEPIGVIDKGEMTATTGGDGDEKAISAFVNTYYKPKTSYSLIFGGVSNGTVTVTGSNPKSDCGKNLGDITTVSAKAKLKGLVMGLATNGTTSKTASGLRRLPTFPERGEIEALVRAEFVKQKVSEAGIKKMNYQNLTAVDVDNDGKPELVGSFWAENSDVERNLLFFIAEKGSDGKYKFGYSEYSKVTPNELMGGAQLTDMDTGRGHELLLDLMEYDGDKNAEIFTMVQGFEGNSFHIYSKRDGKWTRVFEGSNYHCAF